MIIFYTVPKIWHVTYVIVIFHFRLFFPLPPPPPLPLLIDFPIIYNGTSFSVMSSFYVPYVPLFLIPIGVTGLLNHLRSFT